MTSFGESTPSVAGSNVQGSPAPFSKPDRPCDACRKRKSRCVINAGGVSCVLCDFHNQNCTFDAQSVPRKRKAPTPGAVVTIQERKRRSASGQSRPTDTTSKSISAVEDYADLQGESLLKSTLGLQNHRHATYIGASSEFDRTLLNFHLYDNVRAETSRGDGAFRKVGATEYFHQFSDAETLEHAREVEDLDAIESIVSPHGEELIRLYFRIVHPSFPILHKKVYLEKYARSHQEFVPPLLAAVYILALDWWSYSSELSKHPKPDVSEIQQIAFRSLQSAIYRPKLSTLQAGLLLLQKPGHRPVWQFVSQLVALGQDLGLHRDCSNWRIPTWEIGLRKRLGWALYMQSTWASFICGRPLQFPPTTFNWAVQTVTSKDFPETAADEDEEDGSTEVEKGRTLFCAMISLTKLLAEILHNLYSTRAEAEIASSYDRASFVLEKMKDLQLRLRKWYVELPENLRMKSNSKVGKLSSIGWLHTSYFAAEMSLHRAVLQNLSTSADLYIVQVCRTAAKERLKGAIELFNQLRPEHLQSFWYFASSFNFALTGIFAALCMVTSLSHDEAEEYRHQLQAYRWSLRVSSKGAEFLEIAVQTLESSVGPLLTRRSSSDSTGDGSKGTDASPFAFLTHRIGEDEEDPIDFFLSETADRGYYGLRAEI